MRRIVLISDDELLHRRISAAADGLASVALLPTAGFESEVAAIDPALVLLVLDTNRAASFLTDSFASLAAIDPELPVVVLGDASSGNDVVAAVRAGSADFIDRDEAVAAMRDHLKRRFAAMSEADHGEAGNFAVVLEARPGSGAGSFALNLALTRAPRHGEALLVDCQQPASEAAAALDMTLAYSMADAIRDAGRLDRTLLQSALAQHKASGVRVLPLMLRGGDNGGVSPEAVLKVLGALRHLFRETVVNASEIRDPAILTALSKWASTIYIVCPQKFTALADAKDLLMALPLDVGSRTMLVVDAFSPGIGLSPEQMLEALGLTRVTVLPDARDDLVNGLNVGRPFVLTDPVSPYALAVQDASEAARNQAPAAARPNLIQSLARRLRSARP